MLDLAMEVVEIVGYFTMRSKFLSLTDRFKQVRVPNRYVKSAFNSCVLLCYPRAPQALTISTRILTPDLELGSNP